MGREAFVMGRSTHVPEADTLSGMQPIARSLLPLLVTAALAATATAQGPSAGKNILFYGNSYTFFSFGYGVPEVVGLLADAAGQPTPTIVQALIGGSNLGIHATDPAQVAVISNALPAGETWDEVVIQENSVGATPYFGFSPTAFRANAVTIVGNVRSHSPAAEAVLYQTWARAWGHMYYPAPWTDPHDMHAMVRGNYDLAVQDINATYGGGTARKAAVGDAIALLEWDPFWYDPDLSHPGPAMTLVAAMCIYTSIYGQNVCEVPADFTPGSPLETAMSPHGITESLWHQLAGIADRSAAPTNRPFPGSGDYALLLSRTDNNTLSACHVNEVTAGTSLQLQMRSVNGAYNSSTGVLLVDFIATGSPPGALPGLPEVQVNLSTVALTPVFSLANPHTISLQLPFTLPGGSFLVQGVALQASQATGNPLFTTTDAHELVFH